jgi:CcmD family protein
MLVTLLQVAPPSNLTYLFAAFAVSWLIFFAYAFFVSRKQQEMEREISQLRRLLEDRKDPGAV